MPQYVLSNNHINRLIAFPDFDFSDSEILAYYVSFLKTLSLKLNPVTVQFFYNTQTGDFPLYTEAVKFFTHEDSMVRIAVRTATLNIFRVEDAGTRAFIMRRRSAAPFLSTVVWFVRDQCEDVLKAAPTATHVARDRVGDALAELLDLLFYVQDIFSLCIPAVAQRLTRCFLAQLLCPILLDGARQGGDATRQVVCIALLGQIVNVFGKDNAVLPVLAALLLGGGADEDVTVGDLADRYLEDVEEKEEEAAADSESSTPADDMAVLRRPLGPPMWPSLMALLEDGSDERLVLFTVCIMLDLIGNEGVPAELLSRAGVMPQRQQRAQSLLAALTGGDGDDDDALLASAKPVATAAARSLLVAAEDASGGNDPLSKAMAAGEEDADSEGDEPAGGEAQASTPPAVGGKSGEELVSKGVEEVFVLAAMPSSPLTDPKYPQELVGALLRVLARTGPAPMLVTVQTTVRLVLKLVYVPTDKEHFCVVDPHLALADAAYDKAAAALAQCAADFDDKDLFVDMFEDIFRNHTPLRHASIVNDSSLLLPLAESPLSRMPLAKRRPSGQREEAQAAIKAFLELRQLKFTLRRRRDAELPLRQTLAEQLGLTKGVVLDLSGMDLLYCTVVSPTRRRLSRYMFIRHGHLVLVEPSREAGAAAGMAIVRHVSPMVKVVATPDDEVDTTLHMVRDLTPLIFRQFADTVAASVAPPVSVVPPSPSGGRAPRQSTESDRGGGASSAPTTLGMSSAASKYGDSFKFTLLFEDAMHCLQARKTLDNATAALKADKCEQLRALLGSDF